MASNSTRNELDEVRANHRLATAQAHILWRGRATHAVGRQVAGLSLKRIQSKPRYRDRNAAGCRRVIAELTSAVFSPALEGTIVQTRATMPVASRNFRGYTDLGGCSHVPQHLEIQVPTHIRVIAIVMLSTRIGNAARSRDASRHDRKSRWPLADGQRNDVDPEQHDEDGFPPGFEASLLGPGASFLAQVAGL